MTVGLHGDQKEMEAWFRNHGVPHFMHHYSAGSQVPVVALLLCIVLAFEVGAAPWLEVDTVGMILSPLILFAITLIVLPWLRMIFEATPWPELSRWSWGLRGAALGVASVLLLLSPLPPPNHVTWVSFTLLLSVFAATTMLFSRRLWTNDDPAHVRRRRILCGVILVCVALFGFEGSVFGTLDESEAALPRGLVALACFVPVLLLASTVARGCPDELEPIDRHAPAANFQLTAIPLLLLLFGLETALLPYSHPQPADQGRIQLAAFIGIVLFAAVVAGVGRRRSLKASRGAALLVVLAPLFVVAYPSLVWAYFSFEVFGHVLTGFDAFLVSAGINLVYLGLVWFVVSLGLDRLAVWMAREALRNARSVAEGIGRGLPLLLVFMVFLVMQAELWEVVVEAGQWEFWLIVAAMLLFALGFSVLAARQVVLENCVFEGLDDVAAAAGATTGDSAAPFRASAEARRNGATSASRLTLHVKRVKYLNALAVIVVYQTIVLLPIAVVAAIMFWVLGHIAVPEGVAAEWVYGDDAGARDAAALVARTFWEEPWTRVALVLGAFSALYLTVHILSSSEQRQLFCDGADRAMRRRLAVRLAYVWLVPFDPRRDGSLFLRGRERLSRRSAQQREPAGEARDSAPRPVHGEA